MNKLKICRLLMFTIIFNLFNEQFIYVQTNNDETDIDLTQIIQETQKDIEKEENAENNDGNKSGSTITPPTSPSQSQTTSDNTSDNKDVKDEVKGWLGTIISSVEALIYVITVIAFLKGKITKDQVNKIFSGEKFDRPEMLANALREQATKLESQVKNLLKQGKKAASQALQENANKIKSSAKAIADIATAVKQKGNSVNEAYKKYAQALKESGLQIEKTTLNKVVQIMEKVNDPDALAKELSKQGIIISKEALGKIQQSLQKGMGIEPAFKIEDIYTLKSVVDDLGLKLENLKGLTAQKLENLDISKSDIANLQTKFNLLNDKLSTLQEQESKSLDPMEFDSVNNLYQQFQESYEPISEMLPEPELILPP